MLEFKEGPQNNRVYIQIDDLDNRTHRALRQGFFRLGRDLKATLNKDVLSKDKKGRVYIRKNRRGGRRRHRASAAGQSPANRTGNYRRNIGFQVKGSRELEFGIRDGADYAKFLEEGTIKMAPRPGLRNTVETTERNARTYFESELDAELNES